MFTITTRKSAVYASDPGAFTSLVFVSHHFASCILKATRQCYRLQPSQTKDQCRKFLSDYKTCLRFCLSCHDRWKPRQSHVVGVGSLLDAARAGYHEVGEREDSRSMGFRMRQKLEGNIECESGLCALWNGGGSVSMACLCPAPLGRGKGNGARGVQHHHCARIFCGNWFITVS